MKDLTLSIKITVGFGLLLLISAILGSIAVVSMKSVEGGAKQLAEAHVPEVAVSNNVERNSLLVMYALRGYGLSEKESFLHEGRQKLEAVRKYLAEAKNHAQKHDLTSLLKNEAVATAKVQEYTDQVNETEATIRALRANRSQMDEAAGIFMKNCNDFLSRQKQYIAEEIKSKASQGRLLERANKLILINDIITLGNEVRVRNFKSQATGDMSQMEQAFRNFPIMEKKVDAILKNARRQMNIDLLNRIKSSANHYKNAMLEFKTNYDQREVLNKKRTETGNDVLLAAQETARNAMEHTDKIAKDAASNLSAASLTMIIGLIAALVVGIALAAYLIRSITKPIINAVQTIQDANAQVLAASDQIASSATSLADGATQQASSVEQVSATIEESTANNQQNADNANEANILAKGANDAAAEGNHKIKDLMDSMGNITEASEQIAKIVKTIDEIAFQTNLLALNAAVEAARAGEHGLGFAVVADEVKNLAQRSADSAKETANIIQTTIEQIKHGNEIATATNESFADILEKASKTSSLIGEIAVSVKEQASGMDQIASAMGQIDEQTQTNAASSEEAAAASEELNAQANMMMETVADVAKMVGIDTDETPTVSRVKEKKPKMLAAKPASKMKKQKPSKESEVFDLGDDDLTEF